MCHTNFANAGAPFAFMVDTVGGDSVGGEVLHLTCANTRHVLIQFETDYDI